MWTVSSVHQCFSCSSVLPKYAVTGRLTNSRSPAGVHEQDDAGDAVDDQARGSLAVWQDTVREPALLLHYALLHIDGPVRVLRTTAGWRRFESLSDFRITTAAE